METFIAQAQAGDREAFGQIVREKQRLVLQLTAGYLGWKDAEDAAQVIWTAVWSKIWQVEDPLASTSGSKPWSFATASTCAKPGPGTGAGKLSFPRKHG